MFRTFLARVDRSFTMTLPDGRDVALTLTGCDLVDAGSGSFTLAFRAGPDAPGQGTYALSAEGLDPIPVFLVPAGPAGDGLAYHAVFNYGPPTNDHRTHDKDGTADE